MPVHISKKFQETFASPSRCQIRSSECQPSVHSPQPPKTPINSIQTRAPHTLGSCLPSVSLLFLRPCARKLGLVQASLRLGLLVKHKPLPMELITVHLKAGEGTCITVYLSESPGNSLLTKTLELSSLVLRNFHHYHWWWTAWCAAVHGVAKSRTRLRDWNKPNWTEPRGCAFYQEVATYK